MCLVQRWLEIVALLAGLLGLTDARAEAISSQPIDGKIRWV
jgi:hypothetical protein